MKKLPVKHVYLVASGDLRQSANEACWPGQTAMEKQLGVAIASLGYKVVRGHPYKRSVRHGFIASQREGLDIFAKLDPSAPVIVAEAVWQYSHHVLPGLITHRGPILTVANWSGQWPGLVGMLNLNGSLTKAGVKYDTLWSEDFSDEYFLSRLRAWLLARRQGGAFKHDSSHVRPLAKAHVPARARAVARRIAADLRRRKSIMGVFDEGCMGMYNAIIPDDLLFKCGVCKERMSQSALYFAATQVSDAEARKVFQWYRRKGLKFHFGTDEKTELTRPQVLWQCKTYVAACRLADEFGCETIGIQYQQGLKDLLPASDLVEGTLNSSDRPPVKNAAGRVIRPGGPIVHFNEVDECAGLDGLFTNRVHAALGQPVATTLHDLRWGDWDRSGTTRDYVWVFLISGGARGRGGGRGGHFVDDAVAQNHQFARCLPESVSRVPHHCLRHGNNSSGGLARHGSIWGEVGAVTARALGCVGTITDGAIRDLDEMKAAGFKALARRLAVSHAHCWPLRWGGEVEVFGTKIRPGQLIHADKHGFILIPRDGQKRLLEAARFMDDNECDTVIPAGSASAGLATPDILARMQAAGVRFGASTRRKFGRAGEW